MKNLAFLLSLLLLISCSNSPSNYFTDYYESEELDQDEYISGSSEYVKVLETALPEKVQSDYEKKGYVVIGTVSFDGRWGSRFNLVKQAKNVGAEIAIVKSENSGSYMYTAEIPYLQNHTIQHQGSSNTMRTTYGSISSGGMNIADYNANTYGHTTYSGTSTYQTVESIPVAVEVRNYKQKAIFMARKSGKDS